MPRFSVAFGRRRSTADNFENGVAEPSFRVLDRSEVSGPKPFDGSARTVSKTHTLPKTRGTDIAVEDNIFADLKPNRGSSNTTKTMSTETSSRYSNTSTTPSSADTSGQEEWRNAQRRQGADIPVPPIPKSSSTGFLKAAGRTFSFGGQKKPLPSVPTMEEDQPAGTPEPHEVPVYGRSRATTASTATTVTPPKVDGDFHLDLGGDFGRNLFGNNDKRSSVATVKEFQNGRPVPPPRALTGSRMNQPSPIQIDNNTKVEPSPHSWSSNHSNDQLLNSTSPPLPPPRNEKESPAIPRRASPLAGKPLVPDATPEGRTRRPSLGVQHSSNEQGEGEDEEARLLRDSLSTVTRFMSGRTSAAAPGPSTSRYRRSGDDALDEEDSLFDTSHSYSLRSTSRIGPGKSSPHQAHKVMTPAEFEMYRKDKERQDKERRLDTFSSRHKADEDEDDNYEEDEDDVEKAKQQAKQRRKQEAHMSVYRQQMMKVTGESTNPTLPRPGLQISFSTPNLSGLPNLNTGPSPEANTAENSDEDEEVPLAILAAHGFPNKNRAPTRLSSMMSNPNLRASQQPSYQRPMSAMGDASGAANPRLPAFARKLPQDPFLGAGLVRNSVRESFALGGGSTTTAQAGAAAPPGGLIGVIANEERSRALRRGSPHIDGHNAISNAAPFDPISGIPSHIMYQNNAPAPLTAADQAQIQMTQQMQQFMQMQMQFMQMMTAQNGGTAPSLNGHMAAQSVGNLSAMGGMPGMMGPPSMLGVPGMHSPGGPETLRHSYVGNDSMLDLPNARGGDVHLRTMSMVQPSSASWIQLPQHTGFAPSIRVQGGGYAPSIAPSERSNVGLPGRYRPVSHAPPPHPVAPGHSRKSSTMSGFLQPSSSVNKSGNASDDDDEEGWEAMKAKRDKKKSVWRTKKSLGSEIGAFLR